MSKIIFLIEIEDPLQIVIGVLLVGLGIILLKNNGSKHTYNNMLNISGSILIILLGLLILLGYANIDDIINQFNKTF